jgi:hypothetical protein
MQPNFNEMSDIERRLAACAPAADGLNTDAMLFAAGRASVRAGPATVLWPLALVSVSALTVVLAFLWMSERQERMALASRLRALPPPSMPLPPVQTAPSSGEYDRTPGNLLEVHRALEQERDPLPPEPVINVGTSGPSPAPDILRADSLNHMLDP